MQQAQQQRPDDATAEPIRGSADADAAAGTTADVPDAAEPSSTGQQREFQYQNQQQQIRQQQQRVSKAEQAAKAANLQIEQMNNQLADKYTQQKEAVRAERKQLLNSNRQAYLPRLQGDCSATGGCLRTLVKPTVSILPNRQS